MVPSAPRRYGGGESIARYRLAVHGGAGPLTRERSSERLDAARLDALRESLSAGRAVLERGGSSLDSVEAAVRVLEDCAQFNAGRGSHLTCAETVEMDAAVMDGRSCRAGAVAAVRRLRHPVGAARAVFEDGAHVLLVGEPADRLAEDWGLESVGAAELVAAAREAARARAPASPGTVGAVARDSEAHLAAATSTGGTRGKRPGRVGDSPLIGSGTWADDRTCAVSGTGDGEIFIRTAFAHEIDARLRLAGESLERACRLALERVATLEGAGGCVALAGTGDAVLAHNTPYMARGEIGPEGRPRVALYADEPI